MNALERLALEVEDLFQVSCRFECDRPVLIRDGDTATDLYHIAAGGGEQLAETRPAESRIDPLSGVGEPFLQVDDDGVGGFRRGRARPGRRVWGC